MTHLVYGERIGKTGKLAFGANGVIFDSTRTKVLLTRRSDNGLWCLPGGHIEAGEGAAEACAREVWEETSLRVEVERLIGVYSTPHRVVQYADGNRYQIMSLAFECRVLAGEPALSDETTGVGYYAPDEYASLPLMEHHLERLADAYAGQSAAFIR